MNVFKKLSYGMFALAFAVTLSACSGGTQQPNAEDFGGQVYTSEEYGVAMNHADDWEVQNDIFGTVVAFLSPLPEDGSDLFQDNVNLVVQDLMGEDVPLADLNTEGTRQLENFIDGFELVSSEKATLAGEEAYRNVYKGEQAGFALQWLQVLTIFDGKNYVLTYTAEEGTFEEHMDDVNLIIDSFRQT